MRVTLFFVVAMVAVSALAKASECGGMGMEAIHRGQA